LFGHCFVLFNPYSFFSSMGQTRVIHCTARGSFNPALSLQVFNIFIKNFLSVTIKAFSNYKCDKWSTYKFTAMHCSM
jgi:hypothetical protein